MKVTLRSQREVGASFVPCWVSAFFSCSSPPPTSTHLHREGCPPRFQPADALMPSTALVGLLAQEVLESS